MIYGPDPDALPLKPLAAEIELHREADKKADWHRRRWEPGAIAYRTPVQIWDGPRGQRWRGGTLRRSAGQPARLTVLAEPSSPLDYYGPVATLSECVPVACRMSGQWPYKVVQVVGGYWASSSDARRAQEGEPIYGCIPAGITGQSAELWREESSVEVSGS